MRAKAVIARDLRELRKREELRNPVAHPSESVAVAMEQGKIDGAQAEAATRDENILGEPANIVKTEDAYDASAQPKEIGRAHV